MNEWIVPPPPGAIGQAGPPTVRGHPVCGPPLGRAGMTSGEEDPASDPVPPPAPWGACPPSTGHSGPPAPCLNPGPGGGGTPHDVAEAGCRLDAGALLCDRGHTTALSGPGCPPLHEHLASSHSRVSQGLCPPGLPRLAVGARRRGPRGACEDAPPRAAAGTGWQGPAAIPEPSPGSEPRLSQAGGCRGPSPAGRSLMVRCEIRKRLARE